MQQVVQAGSKENQEQSSIGDSIQKTKNNFFKKK